MALAYGGKLYSLARDKKHAQKLAVEARKHYKHAKVVYSPLLGWAVFAGMRSK